MSTLSKALSGDRLDVVSVFDDRTGRFLKRFPITNGDILAAKARARVWSDARANRTGRGVLLVSPKHLQGNPTTTIGEKTVIGGVLLVGALAVYYALFSSSSSSGASGGSGSGSGSPIYKVPGGNTVVPPH